MIIPVMRAVSAHFLSVPRAMGIGPMKITAAPPVFMSVDCVALIIMKTMPRIMRSMPIVASGVSMVFCWVLGFLLFMGDYLVRKFRNYFEAACRLFSSRIVI